MGNEPASPTNHKTSPGGGSLGGFFQTVQRKLTSGSMKRRVLKESASVLAIGLVASGLAYGGVMLARPSIDQRADLYALNRPPSFTFVDNDGQVLGHHGPFVGERIKLSEMPDYLPAAFLAMEDRTFYHHGGVDPKGLARALVANLEAGDTVAGGSTITQQLVKILFLTPERTFTRKFRELGGAWTLERNLSKDQILELYLNRIYLGSGAYGVDGAARTYFGKSAREVTLQEAAMLAALTRSPSVFTPRRDLEAAQERSKVVLQAMVDTGALKPEMAVAAAQKPATISDRSNDLARNYYFDAAAAEVQRIVPQINGDLVVTTAFDPRMQDAARRAVESVMQRRSRAMRAGQAALVSMTPDGGVRALVGGRDYSESQFNRATDAKRQPGSAFKLFVYLAALEAGMSPWSVRDDGRVDVGGYAPGNFDNKHFGQVTLLESLTRSLNTVAIKLQQEVGVRAVVRTAQRLGITSPLQAYASLALGTSEVTPLELTSAYAALASGGYKVTPYMVVEVRTPAGDVLYRHRPARPTRVIAEDKVTTMNAMLYEVVQSGTGRAANLGAREVAGKTGTSSDFRDAWFVGYTNEMVTAVWVGNDDFKPMKRVTGGSLPAQIWNGYMKVALQKYPPSALPRMLPPPTSGYDYVAYADPNDAMMIPPQDESNGFYVDVPGMFRDMFSSSPGPDSEQSTDTTASNAEGQRNEGDSFARERDRDNDREAAREREEEEREIARARRDAGGNDGSAPQQQSGAPPRQAATPAPAPAAPRATARLPLTERELARQRDADRPQTVAPVEGEMPPVGDLEAQRRAMVERNRQGFARPEFNSADPYAEREDSPRYARRLPPPDPDMAERDLDPGYFGEEPPPPPPEPDHGWFGRW